MEELRILIGITSEHASSIGFDLLTELCGENLSFIAEATQTSLELIGDGTTKVSTIRYPDVLMICNQSPNEPLHILVRGGREQIEQAKEYVTSLLQSVHENFVARLQAVKISASPVYNPWLHAL